MRPEGDGITLNEAPTRLLISRLARECGFSAAGVAPCALPQEEARLQDWLAKDYHAQME